MEPKNIAPNGTLPIRLTLEHQLKYAEGIRTSYTAWCFGELWEMSDHGTPGLYSLVMSRFIDIGIKNGA